MNIEKKYKNLLIISIILLVSVVLLGGYIAYDKILSKNDNEEETQNDTKKDQATLEQEILNKKSFAFANANDIYVVNATGTLEKISSNYVGAAAKRLININNNILYYVAKDNMLHSINLENNEDKNLNITINSNINGITVVDNTLITQYQENYVPKADLYNLTTKEKTTSPIKSNNISIHVYDNYFCYSSDALYCYDVSTGKVETIEAYSYIIGAEGSKIVYKATSSTDRTKVTDYLYDLNNKTKTALSTYTQTMFSAENNVIISDNSIYYINDKKLSKIENGKSTELQNLNTNNYYLVEYKMYKLSENKILIKEFGNKKEECNTSDVLSCNEGTTKYYYYDIKTGKLEETSHDYSAMNNSIIVAYNN